jgi:hypothetical protein
MRRMPIATVLLLGVLLSCSGNKETHETATQDQTARMDTARVISGAVPSAGVPDATSLTDSNAAAKQDIDIFTQRIDAAKQYAFRPLAVGERVAAFGRLFIGTPYVAGTLDLDSNGESLVVNLRGLDCVTFYENALALARLIRQPSPTFNDYKRELELLRYRDGKLNGYASRLHYTVDYFRNSEKKGIMKDVTRDVAGRDARLDTRTINFMSTHRTAYKQLSKDDRELQKIRDMEASMNSAKGFYYIPKNKVASTEKNIQTGDILGITTDIAGLDCSHTGIAVRTEDGRVHFMHASSLQHKVILGDEPLSDYLTHSSHQTGVIVMRPLEVTNAR